MSEHRATIDWERGAVEFTYDAYSRSHTWTFESGIRVDASAAPAYRGSAERVDPEEAFVAALASCHMLTFLAIASRKRIVVDHYTDAAVGILEENEDGRLAITKVTLRPRIAFEGDAPSDEQLAKLHEQAHASCFLASSVRTRIEVEPA